MAVKILVDSTFDFTEEELAALGLEVVRMRVLFGEEEFVDGLNITPRGFYERLIESDELPTTSQASPADFSAAFERLTAAGDEVLCMTLSRKLSGTFQSAQIAAEDFPGRVRVVDTESVTMGANILARYGLRLLGQGLGLEEAAAELERARRRVHVLAMLDTLEYLRRGGRVTGLAALAGGLMAIKPVVTLRDGLVSVIGKARGSKNAENLLTQTIDRCGVDFSMPYTLGYTGLSDAMLHKYKADSARLWAGKAEDLPVMLIGSVIGTHAGPGAVGVAFFALRDE